MIRKAWWHKVGITRHIHVKAQIHTSGQSRMLYKFLIPWQSHHPKECRYPLTTASVHILKQDFLPVCSRLAHSTSNHAHILYSVVYQGNFFLFDAWCFQYKRKWISRMKKCSADFWVMAQQKDFLDLSRREMFEMQ